MTIVKAKRSEFIFGGFTTVDWDSSDSHKSDPNAFLFSLTNKDNIPVKIKIHPNEHHCAIYCDSDYGPTFGYSGDIHIADNANTTMNSCSDLGGTYSHPQYEEETMKLQHFWLDQSIFNWLKLKSIKRNRKFENKN